jgi:hypothetical protein
MGSEEAARSVATDGREHDTTTSREEAGGAAERAMTERATERLISRIRQIRRSAASAERPAPSTAAPDNDVTRALEQRVMHLEQLVEGLQDSVHREAQRHDKRIAELEARMRPEALSQALSRDARERGL